MKRILFVDDEKQVLDGIRRMFIGQHSDWELQFAVGGEAALELCQASTFDVVVSDMRMPGIDGATLLHHIKDRFPDAARLILTGYSDIALATRAVPVAHRVLGKPCDEIELQTSIESVCKLQDIFCSPELRRVVGSIGELPSLSATYSALAKVVQDPAASLPDIAAIIEKDIAMAAKVLQLVNRGFFGVAQTVSSLLEAVSYLGLNTIRNLALASETFRVFVPDARIPASFCEEMQRRAYRSARIAGTFPLPPSLRGACVVSALLHDIGELVLAYKLPEVFCAALTLARTTGCTQIEAEEQLLGTSHAEIGAYLLGLWGIDSLVVEAVAHHHRPDRIPHVSFDATMGVYLTNLLAHECDQSLETLGSYRDCPGRRSRIELGSFGRGSFDRIV